MSDTDFGRLWSAIAVVASVLEIDAAKEAESITRNIRGLAAANSAEGVIMGLSGGIDSAVLAALAARAVGKEGVGYG